MEEVGWLVVGAAVLSYMHTGSVLPPQVQAPLPSGPDTSDEPDLKRWRHDGAQPSVSRVGNDSSFIEDERVQSILAAL